MFSRNSDKGGAGAVGGTLSGMCSVSIACPLLLMPLLFGSLFLLSIFRCQCVSVYQTRISCRNQTVQYLTCNAITRCRWSETSRSPLVAKYWRSPAATDYSFETGFCLLHADYHAIACYCDMRRRVNETYGFQERKMSRRWCYCGFRVSKRKKNSLPDRLLHLKRRSGNLWLTWKRLLLGKKGENNKLKERKTCCLFLCVVFTHRLRGGWYASPVPVVLLQCCIPAWTPVPTCLIHSAVTSHKSWGVGRRRRGKEEVGDWLQSGSFLKKRHSLKHI